MRQDLETLQRRFATVVETMGYEIVGVEFHPRQDCALLRVYIDQADEASQQGITLDDCERVSHQLSGFLDVEDPIAGAYNLEISSPGLDRPLFEAKHFVRFAGAKARLQLYTLLNGRRKLIGKLLGMEDDAVVLLLIEDQTWRVPLDQIEKARLVPEW